MYVCVCVCVFKVYKKLGVIREADNNKKKRSRVVWKVFWVKESVKKWSQTEIRYGMEARGGRLINPSMK